METEETRTRRHWRLALGLALVVVLGSTWFIVFGGYGLIADAVSVSGSNAATGESGGLEITGDAKGLWPGTTVPLDLELLNPNAFALSVSGILVSVDHIDAPNAKLYQPCTMADFALRQSTVGSAIAVGPHASFRLSSLDLPSSTWPGIEMLERPRNQDGCKGATLSLRYSATGLRSAQ